MTKFLILLSAALVSTPAMADAPMAAPVAAAPAGKAEKQICITTEKVGSLFPKRVCATKAEWDRIKADSKQGLDQIQRNPNQLQPQ